MTNPLKDILKASIETSGPLGLDTFMQLALHHNPHGYYFRGQGIGRKGDFITAPEISPLFGQCLARWVNRSLESLKPSQWRLVELGPGRGTLLSTLLPHLRSTPNELCLVEASPHFQQVISDHLPYDIRFFSDLGNLPESPLPTIFLANEYLDALPIRQFQCQNRQCFEICVGIDGDDLRFVRRSAQPHLCPLDDGQDGWWEVSAAAISQVQFLAQEILTSGGAVLLIDYGYLSPEGRPTLQALENHKMVEPLSSPGQADLTALVDFGRLSDVVKDGGLSPRVESQQSLLLGLGLEKFLEENRNEAATVARLVREDGMGQLYQALSFFAPSP